MPASKVDRREQGVDRHLALAAEYIKIAESGDAKRTAYEHAADEIIAAQEANPKLKLREIDRRLGREKWGGDYSSRIVRWRRASAEGLPFSDINTGIKRDAVGARKIARESPDDFVAAYDAAPPEARRRIAQRISHAPEVRSEARQRDNEAEQRRRPESIPPRADTAVFNFEQRLVGARRYLRDALDLVNEIEQPGDDEDILETIEMLKQMLDAIDESYRSGQSLESWAWELYERSAE